MTAEGDDMRAELIRRLIEGGEQMQAMIYAAMLALRVDPDGAELRALMEVEPPDPAPMADWLRAHEWLDVDPVAKLGRSARVVLAWDRRQQERAEHGRQVAAALHIEQPGNHPN